MPAPLLKPLSRGTVTLDPSDPFGLPVVQYNTLQNPIDRDNVLAIVRRAREFWRSPVLVERFGPITEVSPGAQFRTDEEILDELKRNHGIFWPSLAHPSGTCAMMPERVGGCVDAELKVYGVKRLRVVDASVMPLIVGGGLQATVYAVAEKAADLIKGKGNSHRRDRGQRARDALEETEEEGTGKDKESDVDDQGDEVESEAGTESTNRLGGYTWGFPRKRAEDPESAPC